MKTTKKLQDTAKKPRPKPPAAGNGRPKGALNKNTRLVKDMIMQALTKAGGIAYLTRQATENPKAFLPLVGKLLPLQVTGEGGGPVEIVEIRRVVVDPVKAT